MPAFNNFTTKAKDAIRKSHELAIERGQNHVNTFHLLTALILQEEGMTLAVLEKMEVDTVLLTDSLLESIDAPETGTTASPSYQIYLTPDLAQVIEESAKIARTMNDEFVSTEHLFLAVIEVPGQAQELLNRFRIKRKDVLNVLKEIQEDSENNPRAKKQFRVLLKYTRNLTALAREDKLDPVIGRDQEIMRIIQILSRRTKNNPILLGEPGTGKTAIVEGLAIRMSKGDVPESLRDKDLVVLDLGLLLAGTKYRGEFEDRLKKIMKEIEESDRKVVLFIDEIHTLVGAGSSEGTMDAANMLKPALARGELRAIGATTLGEYQKHFEKDPALARRFQPVYVDEPSVTDAVAILRGLKHKYELYHGVRITDDALLAAVNLSSRYITNRFLPDKAVDLIDEAASSLRITLENKPPQLEEAHRKIMRLEIEKEALKKESEEGDSKKKAQDRINEINHEIAEIKEKNQDLEIRWRNEKNLLIEIRAFKKELDEARVEAEHAELQTDLGRVAEIRYGKIPALEKKLKLKMDKLRQNQKKRQVLREEVTEEDIATVVARWTNIPVLRMLEEEQEKLVRMEQDLKNRVKGQDEAIEKISDAIRRSRVGISDPNRPIGSFVFLGPTGVGKTELTKALTEFMFNDEKALIRVDMSEYMEKHSTSKLIGSPPGYVGYEESGQFTEAVRHRPYSVVLFDEVEKAHPDVFNLLLQVLDEGHLTDGKGRKINFKNTIIIMTSNLGSQHIQKMQSIGFSDNTESEDYKETKDKVMESLKNHFRPEFLNRLDDIIVFDVLSRETIKEIVTQRVIDITKRLTEKNITIELTPKAIDYLAEHGYDQQYGARPLNRLIQNKILNRVASLMVRKELAEGGTVQVGILGDDFDVQVKKKTRKIAKTIVTA
ncbi:MAG: AAA family ATPase [Candidatus Pacebacteria bacterium]|nr:AAA family ATPase [Candidatus Paceibacterota bacterium]